MRAFSRIHCPLLAFYGTNDVGDAEDLELLKSSIKCQPTGPSSVKTVIINGAYHMYAGQESQVADVVATWADTLLPGKGEAAKRP